MSFRSVRVIDCAMGWAGPLVSFVLAQLGAEVIKVEARQHFDWWRGPHPRDAARGADGAVIPYVYEMAAVYNSVNRHKQGVTLDLTSPAGRAALLDLVRVSDVLVENFTPHAMAALDLAYPTLAAANPQLVMLSMPAFGSTGPERDYIGYGMTIEAMSGMTALTGYQDGPPQMMANAYGDPVSGLNGAVAAMIALRARERTGRGCHVEIAQVEGFIPLVAGALLDRQMNRRDGERAGNRHHSMAPHGVYPCRAASPSPGPSCFDLGNPDGLTPPHRGCSLTVGSPSPTPSDRGQAPGTPAARERGASSGLQATLSARDGQTVSSSRMAEQVRQAPLHRAAGEGPGEGVTADSWVAIAVGSDAAWSALCATIGRPELAVDSRFADVVSRKHNEHAIDPIVATWTRERSREEALTALHTAGVPAAPVQTSADLLSDVQLATRAFFTVVDRAHVGAHPYPDLPFRLEPAPEPDPRPAPCLGEHSEVVLRGLLGMTAAEYDALLHAEVTGTEPTVATDPSPASLERGA